MTRWAIPIVAIATLSPSTAQAEWPEDVQLTGMTEHEGVPIVDRELLGQSFRQLVMELGTLVSNKPITPTETLGIHGLEASFGVQFALTEAHDRLGQPSPWARAHATENNAPYLMVPTLSVRKGLPLSTEIGGHLGWIGGTRTGLFGGWARVAVFEGYKPIPDVALKIGYSGYVGNDQLDLGTLDLGVTLGTTWAVGRLPGVNTGQISPWLNFTTLRVSANATLLDEAIENDIGALRFAGTGGEGDNLAPAIAIPQFGAGVQFTSGNAHIRFAATWAVVTIPTVNTGLGVTF